jgi:hypothetical protein
MTIKELLKQRDALAAQLKTLDKRLADNGWFWSSELGWVTIPSDEEQDAPVIDKA